MIVRSLLKFSFLSWLVGLGWFLPTESSQALSIKDIQDRGVIRIGVKGNLPLMGLEQPDGTLAGLEIDLSRKLVHTIWGDILPIEFIPLSNRQRLSALLEQRVDLVVANMRATDSRRRVVHFSRPYLRSRTSLIGFQSNYLDRICDAKIGVLQGSVAIGRMLSRCPGADYVGFESYGDALRGLQRDQINLLAGDSLIFAGWQRTNPEVNWQLAPDEVGLSPVAIAMPKGLQFQSLHEAVDLALETLEESGDLQQMRNIWGLSAN